MEKIQITNTENNIIKVLFEKINPLIQSAKEPACVAIDGMSGSGKSSLAQAFAKIYNCNLFHMDHFFLRPEQKKEERMREVGGNIDYERFLDEVLIPLGQRRSFFYSIYDCKKQRLSERIQVTSKRLNIIEGVYSQHPYFNNPYTCKIYLGITENIQKERILKRNGEEMLNRFINEWIPKENKYFELYHIAENADVQIFISE